MDNLKLLGDEKCKTDTIWISEDFFQRYLTIDYLKLLDDKKYKIDIFFVSEKFF